ncbi:hypothetical protein [Massilia phyllosphaerae]|uniref:hypothetical protein n=1 Tax=Massilia phyllosphaerae TaxID=3106034 RepID=UPI002B1CBA6C|nr:hypothetical protein [Massilia sp. SGZ-792]
MKKQTKTEAGKGTVGKTPMTQERASAIQRRTTIDNGRVSKEDFAARAASAAARNSKARGER